VFLTIMGGERTSKCEWVASAVTEAQKRWKRWQHSRPLSEHLEMSANQGDRVGMEKGIEGSRETWKALDYIRR
jgi:hypothetical protein